MSHQEMLEHADLLAANKEEIARGEWRLKYHVMPPVGWMNDPNGFVEYNGQYRLFFQYYPGAAEWGPMHWGHVISEDFAHWRYLPTALAPSEEYDCDPSKQGYGCFSGSALPDSDGNLVLMYTGHVDDRVPMQTQNIAISTDGVHFEKYERNPVIAQPPADGTEDFRDPKLVTIGEEVFAVIGNRSEETGRAVVYKSDKSMRSWEYMGVLSAADGKNGTMWECPDLFPLGERFALIFSPMQGAVNTNPLIQLGIFDRKTGQFMAETERVLDGGIDFYAPQTMVDHQGRRILIAWMQQWFQTNVTANEGWAGAMTLPRELTVDERGTIRQVPLPELEALRKAPVVSERRIVGQEGFSVEAPVSCEIKLLLGEETSAQKFRVLVRASEDRKEATVFDVDTVAGTVTCDRTRSGVGNTSESAAKFRPRVGATGFEIRLFLDTCSVELFAASGEATLTNRIYPMPSSKGFAIEPFDGEIQVKELTIWPMGSAYLD